MLEEISTNANSWDKKELYFWYPFHIVSHGDSTKELALLQ